MRGGERVLESLLEVFPQAVLFTLFHERGKVSPRIESHRIVTSWLNRVPGIYSSYRNLLPLFPSAIQSLDLRDFDLVLSSSHAVAKGVRAQRALHICYCHTPMRYIWDAQEDYQLSRSRAALFRLFLPRLQRWDLSSATRVDHFIANSQFVQDRIQKYYGRSSEVISPPIDTDFFRPGLFESREDFYVAAGAMVPYKRLDILVQAFNRLGRPLVLTGNGPEFRKLRRLAGRNIQMPGWVSREALRDLFRRARALVLTAREDFGMATVEAQSCGCPAIALRAGGALETVEDSVNGLLFAEQHPDHLMDAVCRFESMTWPPHQVRSKVENFSRDVFQNKIRRFVAARFAKVPEAQQRPEVQTA